MLQCAPITRDITRHDSQQGLAMQYGLHSITTNIHTSTRHNSFVVEVSLMRSASVLMVRTEFDQRSRITQLQRSLSKTNDLVLSPEELY